MKEEEEEGLLQDDSGELFEHHRFTADPGQNALRVDKFLVDRLLNTSRNKIQAAADANSVIVNEKPVKSNYKIKPGDVVSLMLDYPKRKIEIIKEDIPLNIVHEDNDVIVVNKKPGMVVHPSYGHYSGTLVNALAFHLNNLDQFEEDDPRPGLVHRIDKNTSGLLVIAKNEHAKTHLGKQFFDHSTYRRYYALVWGSFDEKQGTIVGNVGRSLKNR